MRRKVKVSVKLNRIRDYYHHWGKKVLCDTFVKKQLGITPVHIKVDVILSPLSKKRFALGYEDDHIYFYDTLTWHYTALYPQAAFLLTPLFNGKPKIYVKIRIKDCTCTK